MWNLNNKSMEKFSEFSFYKYNYKFQFVPFVKDYTYQGVKFVLCFLNTGVVYRTGIMINPYS